MIDFYLTQRGDIAFSESNTENNRLAIDFYVSKSNVLKIDFDTTYVSILRPSKNALSINFDIIKNKYNKKVNTVNGDAYLIQQASYRLKTSKGEIKDRYEIGSALEKIMHSQLHLKSTMTSLENAVREAVATILKNCRVVAKPAIIKNNGYKQTAIVYIYNDNKLLFEYELE